MKNSTLISLLAVATLSVSVTTFAKLPAPTPEAKEAAELAKAKTAHGDKVAAYQLCQAQDKVAKKYKQTGKDVKTVETPPCKDPGKFVPPEPAAAPATAAAPAAPAPATKAPAPAAAPAAPVKK
jgi:hypothetical protein